MEDQQVIKRLKAELLKAIAAGETETTRDMVIAVLKAAAKLDPPDVTIHIIAKLVGLNYNTVRPHVTILFRDGKVVEGEVLLVNRIGGGKFKIPRVYWVGE